MKYLIPGKLANDPDDLSYTIKVVSGGKLEFKIRSIKNLFYLFLKIVLLISFDLNSR